MKKYEICGLDAQRGEGAGGAPTSQSALGATNGSKLLGMARVKSRLPSGADTADRQAGAPASGRSGSNRASSVSRKGVKDDHENEMPEKP